MAYIVCLAVLAVLAQANAYSLGCGCDDSVRQVRLTSCPTIVSAVIPSSSSFQGNLPTFDLSGSQGQATERVDRNTYQVSLDNTGPSSVKSVPVIRSQKQAPVVQRPTITLPARIPGPRTICNQCKCIKTIVKPQVYEQVITVPTVQRYIQTTHRPVIEKIHYQAVPVNAQDNIEVAPSYDSCQSGSSAIVAVEAPTFEASSSASFVPVQVSSGCEAQVEAPCYEQVPVQTVSYPSC